MLRVGLSLMAVAVLLLIFAGVMEVLTQQPEYFLIMRVGAMLFLIAGPLFGWSIAREHF